MDILVIDDDQYNGQMIGHMLKDYMVEQALSSEDALSMMGQVVPELLIVDLMIPGSMDGLDLIKKIRSDKRWTHIPIISMTASYDALPRVAEMKALSDAFLSKPLSPRKLREIAVKLGLGAVASHK
ncbi:MAG: response regulator [Anaerolineae bacterium]|nr:response regulator [Anaerolineae bacterium]MCA9892070.1 response regulator [Anaerolineae bacterium]